MQNADNEFFESYKQLDKLCSQIFSCENGISEYIAEMECKSSIGQIYVSSWNNDYKMLKHVRWVRNKIAHDSTSEPFSKSEDFDFIKSFYKRIISGNDSLALLRKADSAKKKSVVTNTKNNNERQNENIQSDGQNASKIFLLFVVFGIILIVLGTVILMQQ